MAVIKKQAVLLIALAWLLVLLATTAIISADATTAATAHPQAFNDPNVAHPMAGCRCCTWFRNQYGLLQCGYVCCTDGCC